MTTAVRDEAMKEGFGKLDDIETLRKKKGVYSFLVTTSTY